MSYRVVYSPRFYEQERALSDSVYERVEHSIDILTDNPGIAHDYLPSYDADLPPVDCKWHCVPGTGKIIYFAVDDDIQRMTCFLLGDTREDPRRRFLGVHRIDG